MYVSNSKMLFDMLDQVLNHLNSAVQFRFQIIPIYLESFRKINLIQEKTRRFSKFERKIIQVF